MYHSSHGLDCHRVTYREPFGLRLPLERIQAYFGLTTADMSYNKQGMSFYDQHPMLPLLPSSSCCGAWTTPSSG